MYEESKGRAILVNQHDDINDLIANEVRQSFCPEGVVYSHSMRANDFTDKY